MATNFLLPVILAAGCLGEGKNVLLELSKPKPVTVTPPPIVVSSREIVEATVTLEAKPITTTLTREVFVTETAFAIPETITSFSAFTVTVPLPPAVVTRTHTVQATRDYTVFEKLPPVTRLATAYATSTQTVLHTKRPQPVTVFKPYTVVETNVVAKTPRPVTQYHTQVITEVPEAITVMSTIHEFNTVYVTETPIPVEQRVTTTKVMAPVSATIGPETGKKMGGLYESQFAMAAPNVILGQQSYMGGQIQQNWSPEILSHSNPEVIGAQQVQMSQWDQGVSHWPENMDLTQNVLSNVPESNQWQSTISASQPEWGPGCHMIGGNRYCFPQQGTVRHPSRYHAPATYETEFTTQSQVGANIGGENINTGQPQYMSNFGGENIITGESMNAGQISRFESNIGGENIITGQPQYMSNLGGENMNAGQFSRLASNIGRENIITGQQQYMPNYGGENIITGQQQYMPNYGGENIITGQPQYMSQLGENMNAAQPSYLASNLRENIITGQPQYMPNYAGESMNVGRPSYPGSNLRENIITGQPQYLSNIEESTINQPQFAPNSQFGQSSWSTNIGSSQPAHVSEESFATAPQVPKFSNIGENVISGASRVNVEDISDQPQYNIGRESVTNPSRMPFQGNWYSSNVGEANYQDLSNTQPALGNLYSGVSHYGQESTAANRLGEEYSVMRLGPVTGSFYATNPAQTAMVHA